MATEVNPQAARENIERFFSFIVISRTRTATHCPNKAARAVAR